MERGGRGDEEEAGLGAGEVNSLECCWWEVLGGENEGNVLTEAGGEFRGDDGWEIGCF